MDLFYRSTRSKDERVTASQAILQGLAQDGGLFVPESVPFHICCSKNRQILDELKCAPESQPHFE